MLLETMKAMCEQAENAQAEGSLFLYRGQSAVHYIDQRGAKLESLLPSAYRSIATSLVQRRDSDAASALDAEWIRYRNAASCSHVLMAMFVHQLIEGTPLQWPDFRRVFSCDWAAACFLPWPLQHYGDKGLSTDFTRDIRVAFHFALKSTTNFPCRIVLYQLLIQKASQPKYPIGGMPMEPNEWTIGTPRALAADRPLKILNLSACVPKKALRVVRQQGFSVDGFLDNPVPALIEDGLLSKHVLVVQTEQEKSQGIEYLGNHYSEDYLLAKDEYYRALEGLKNGSCWGSSHDTILRHVSAEPTEMKGVSRAELFSYCGLDRL